MLRPFTTTDLAIVENWFKDSQTRRWLGDNSWPRDSLALAVKAKNRHLLAFEQKTKLIAMIDIECYPNATASLALVVDPKLRRLGLGKAALKALMASPQFTNIQVFIGGVEQGNLASLALMISLGFKPTSTTPNIEGFTDFIFYTTN